MHAPLKLVGGEIASPGHILPAGAFE